MRGYLGKRQPVAEVVTAVRLVAAGQRILAEPASVTRARELTPLTPREYEVLRLLAAGWRNARIAQALGLTLKTVEFHVRNQCAKLGASSRGEAVRAAHHLGLIRLHEGGEATSAP